MALFPWEQGFEDCTRRLVSLDDIRSFRLLLDDLRVYLHLSPEEMLKKMPKTPESCSLYGCFEAFMLVCELRILQWRAYYRGPVQERGKVISIKFRSDLTGRERIYLEDNVKYLKNLM